MWASHRITSLLNENTQGNTAQVVGLGEAYSIVTEYTSFLVLENDSEYKRWKIDRRNALRIKRDRAARDVVNEQLSKLRNDAMQQFAQSVNTNTTANNNINLTQNIGTPTLQAPTPAVTPQQPSTPNDNSRDLNWARPSGGGGGFGGGAIDPMMACIVVGLSMLALIRVSRRRNSA
jgi:hypothetical protein